eukprot:TRINITY_DN35172_c0_g1_i1.p1 TRINITY_DN35172_c0_g1~~TRINITY_DN35172_c0_g1_i1.p1  ORF type:complete len:219 (-),score=19.71 TRINITY_DN35172_c0_g1_i1:309-875(-)
MLRRLLAAAFRQAPDVTGSTFRCLEAAGRSSFPQASTAPPYVVWRNSLSSRNVSISAPLHHQADTDPNAEKITVTFVDRDGSRYEVQAPVGMSMLEVAHKEDIDLEGACEGSLACSTCHVIIEDQKIFDMLPEAEDDENDMLDLAFGLTSKSRLGCQVIAAPELDGMVMKIPDATRNFAVDGHRPKPH